LKQTGQQQLMTAEHTEETDFLTMVTTLQDVQNSVSFQVYYLQ